MGPLSNAAGAQSIPQIKAKGKNTAINLLPPDVTPSDLDLACETWSDADLMPRVPLIHGFCFGIKKEVIERIGFFDEENFKLFYGERRTIIVSGQSRPDSNSPSRQTPSSIIANREVSMRRRGWSIWLKPGSA